MIELMEIIQKTHEKVRKFINELPFLRCENVILENCVFKTLILRWETLTFE